MPSDSSVFPDVGHGGPGETIYFQKSKDLALQHLGKKVRSEADTSKVIDSIELVARDPQSCMAPAGVEGLTLAHGDQLDHQGARPWLDVYRQLRGGGCGGAQAQEQAENLLHPGSLAAEFERVFT